MTHGKKHKKHVVKVRTEFEEIEVVEPLSLVDFIPILIIAIGFLAVVLSIAFVKPQDIPGAANPTAPYVMPEKPISLTPDSPPEADSANPPQNDPPKVEDPSVGLPGVGFDPNVEQAPAELPPLVLLPVPEPPPAPVPAPESPPVVEPPVVTVPEAPVNTPAPIPEAPPVATVPVPEVKVETPKPAPKVTPPDDQTPKDIFMENFKRGHE